MRNIARFGPAGGDDYFHENYKSTEQIPEYLNKIGLNAYEYQAGNGVRISSEKAAAFGKIAKESGIALSLHAPYYISLSSIDEEKRLGSAKYVLQSLKVSRAMGADRIVVHCGSAGKISREEATVLAKDTLRHILSEMDKEGYGDIFLCIETMGKINQLGTLSEVLELCTLSPLFIPCVDFGHLNARTGGGLKTAEDYEKSFTRRWKSSARKK